MTEDIIIDLDAVIKQCKDEISYVKGNVSNIAVAIFDLSGSVFLKLEKGHTLATRSVFLHNAICRKIVETFRGTIIKELGDGVLCKFQNDVLACRASIKIMEASQKVGLITKGALTSGSTEEVELKGTNDIYGTTVDRCARILSYALPNQILIDQALYESVKSYLKDEPAIITSGTIPILLKDFGRTEVYELSASQKDIQQDFKTPFLTFEDGRLPIEEKVAFMKGARSEIIELGVGLTTFSGYFENRNPSEWKDHICNLLKNGVSIKFLAIDPTWPGTKDYLENRREIDYLKEIQKTSDVLRKQKQDFEKRHLAGSFEFYRYRRYPTFYAVCVDADSPSGRIQISDYLHGMNRSVSPIIQFSRRSNPLMFDKYWQSIKYILEGSQRLW